MSANRTQHQASIDTKRFLWHLNLPWLKSFSHRHWWGETPVNVDIDAVIWEIFRRHPNTEILILKNRMGSLSGKSKELFLKQSLSPYWQNHRREFDESIRLWSSDNGRVSRSYDLLLLQNANCSWSDLPKLQQERWKAQLLGELKPQYGFNPPPPDVVETFPNLDSIANILKAVNHVKSKSGKFKLWLELWNQELKKAKGDQTGTYYWGCIHVRFDPSQANIEKVMKEIVRDNVRKWRKLFPTIHIQIRQGRARAINWLKIIKVFEESALSLGKKQIHDDQDFARYYRIIGKWNF